MPCRRAQVRLPARCLELLRPLLEVLSVSQGARGLRSELYGALLHFMHLCRWGRCT